MSQLEVDKIIPQSGTTLTIGDSGDTVNFADGTNLSIDSNTLYIDSTNNRVGIANSSPSVALDVTGAANVSGDLTVDTNTLFVDASENTVVIGGTDATSWNTNADELVVAGGSAGGMTFYNPTQSNIFFADGTTGFDVSRGRIQYVHSGDSLLFGTDATERMRIDGSGHVLVGTSDPLAGVSYSSGKGIALRSEGYIFASIPNDAPLTINRQTSDGNIAQFRKNGVTVGSIGSRSGTSNIYIESLDSGRLRANGVDVAGWNSSNGSLFSASDNGNDLGTTGNRWKDIYLGGGLYVGGTGTANKLDDYEEGTWTPAIYYEGNSITEANMRNQGGLYTKVGNIVHCYGYFDTTGGAGSGTGNVSISGIPFVPVNASGSNYGSLVNVGTSISQGWTTQAPEYGRLSSNQRIELLYYNGTVGAYITASNVSSSNPSNRLHFSFSFRTNS